MAKKSQNVPLIVSAPAGTGDLPASPAKPPRKWGGGPATHKPGCKCYPCKARRRQEETLAGRAGESEPLPTLIPEEEKLNADLPVFIEKSATQRSRIAEWINLRATNPGITTSECAVRMGIAPCTLHSYISRARKAGYLVFDDPMTRLEHEIIPKVTDNLNYYLDQRDRTVTIETAKGTIFKQFQAEQGIQEQNQTVLAIKIEYPEGLVDSPEVKVISGNIVGKPKIDTL